MDIIKVGKEKFLELWYNISNNVYKEPKYAIDENDQTL
jgi:hypothetical protein